MNKRRVIMIVMDIEVFVSNSKQDYKPYLLVRSSQSLLLLFNKLDQVLGSIQILLHSLSQGVH